MLLSEPLYLDMVPCATGECKHREWVTSDGFWLRYSTMNSELEGVRRHGGHDSIDRVVVSPKIDSLNNSDNKYLH